MRLNILFGDTHVFVVYKPGGMPCVADKTGDAALVDMLRADGVTGFLELPHRLDRPVSGAVVVARSADVLANLNTAFAEGAVRKTYWAIVHGAVPESGVWEHRLVHDARAHRARVVEAPSGQVVRTRFQRLGAGTNYSAVALLPEGGRFHQLRAQCAAGGFPIKADVKYGARRGEPDRTIALHARSIAFEHPVEGDNVQVEALVPGTPLWAPFMPLLPQ